MDYILISLISKSGFSILEFERIKNLINQFLEVELVDNESIFWDEDGDLMFHPPLHKKDRNYWINSLNACIDNKNWHFTTGKVY